MKFIKNIIHVIESVIANVYFGFPSRKLTVIGITGTDGKTTTANYTHSIFTAAGIHTGLISTISAKFGDKEIDTGFHVTSPSGWNVQRILREMVNEGITHVVLEVTSHAISQHRFWGITFDVTALTNITPEHLDYHKNFESYKNTKLSFIQVGRKQFMSDDCKDSLLEGVSINLVGDYNRSNARLAACIANALGISRQYIKQGVESLTQLSGRMETVHKGVFRVMVDFAHTPNALEHALTSARKFVEGNGRLIVVFGSAGQRDTSKRASMGSTSSTYADIQVITAEDPRSEHVIDICSQIAAGIESIGGKKDKTYYVEPDRFKAIEFAITKLAHQGDVVIITGKGHEKSMNLDGKTETPWSDQETVKTILKEATF